MSTPIEVWGESSTNSIICPYCQYEEKTEYEMYFGNEPVDVFEEGDQILTCPACHTEFKLSKRMEWIYETDAVR